MTQYKQVFNHNTLACNCYAQDSQMVFYPII